MRNSIGKPRLPWPAPLVALVLVAALAYPVNAAEDVGSASSERFRETLVVAAHFNAVKGFERYQTAWNSRILRELYASSSDLSADEYLQNMTKLENAFDKVRDSDARWLSDSQRSDVETWRKVIEYAQAIPKIPGDQLGLAPSFLKALKTVNEQISTEELTSIDLSDSIALGNQQAADSVVLQQTLESDLREDISLAHKDPKFAALYQATIGSKTGVPLDASVNTVIADPAVRTVYELIKAGGLIEQTGAIRLDLTKLKNLVQTGFDSMNDQFRETLGVLGTIAADQRVIKDWIDSERKRQAAEALVEAERQQWERGIAGARSTTYVLSTLIGFADPKLGHQVDTVGNAVISVVDSVSKYAKAMAGLGETVGKAADVLGQALSTAVLTGNVLSAAMSVVGLFIDTGPTTDELILTQIGELRDDISQLGSQMHDRFDRIDEGLNLIYGALQDGLNDIRLELGSIDHGVTVLRSDLSRLQTSLRDLESGIYDIVFNAAQRSFWLTADETLAFAQTHAQISFSTFLKYATFFHTWATRFSSDPLSTGPAIPPGADDSDGIVVARLSLPLDRNLNYLAALVEHRVGTAEWSNMERLRVGGAVIPNPQQWALAARAFARLEAQWPEYAQRLPESWTPEMLGVGVSLRDTFGGVSRNAELFDELLANYRGRLAELDMWIAAIETDFKAHLGIDPFLFSYQQFPASPADVERRPITACDASADAIAAPNTQLVLDPYVEIRYLNAHDSRIAFPHNFQLCYAGAWAVLTVNKAGARAPWCVTRQLTTAITLTDRGVDVFKKSLTGPVEKECSPDKAHLVVEQGTKDVAERWDQGLRLAFEDGAIAEFFDRQSFNAANEEVYQAMRFEQTLLYERISQAVDTATEVEAPARLSGAKALINAFTALGLPRALESDDYLMALLLGNQSIYDANLVTQAYSRAAASVPLSDVGQADDLIGENVKSFILSSARDRVQALDDVIHTYLSLVEEGSYDETHQLVEAALSDLAIAGSLVGETPSSADDSGTLLGVTVGQVLGGHPSES